MSSFSTFSPSFEQTYCCFRRAPSFSFNWLHKKDGARLKQQYLLPVLRADVLLLQTGPVFLVQPVERDRGRRLAGGKHFDRDRDEPEGNRGGTNGMRGHRACW